MKQMHLNVLDLCGAGIFALLAGSKLQEALRQTDPLAWLLVLQSGLVAYRLVFRKPNLTPVPVYQTGAAWGSVFLLQLLQTGAAQPWQIGLSAAGIVLACWGLLALGPAFGIAPADRGLVTTGPYRYLRHPMYAGALLSGLAAAFGPFSAWNGLVGVALLLALGLRIHWEERLIAGYLDYARQVRWRLLPGVW